MSGTHLSGPLYIGGSFVGLGGPIGNVYFVDPVNGSDGNDGLTPATALALVKTAYDLCVSGHHDVVALIESTTSNALAAAFAWSKNFTHLIGLSNNLPGIGQRCGITGSAALDLTYLINFSGIGCMIRNIRFYNGGDADAAVGAVIVSGSRNEFTNCFFAGMESALPAAHANSYSLKVTGSENLFDHCLIGYDSVTRGAGEPAELWLATGCSKALFVECRILTRSDTITASPVLIDAQNLGYVEFKDCIFINTSTNWATALTDCFSISISPNTTHYIALRGACQLVGITGWADTPTRIYASMPLPHNTGGTNAGETT